MLPLPPLPIPLTSHGPTSIATAMGLLYMATKAARVLSCYESTICQTTTRYHVQATIMTKGFSENLPSWEMGSNRNRTMQLAAYTGILQASFCEYLQLSMYRCIAQPSVLLSGSVYNMCNSTYVSASASVPMLCTDNIL